MKNTILFLLNIWTKITNIMWYYNKYFLMLHYALKRHTNYWEHPNMQNLTILMHLKHNFWYHNDKKNNFHFLILHSLLWNGLQFRDSERSLKQSFRICNFCASDFSKMPDLCIKTAYICYIYSLSVTEIQDQKLLKSFKR